ncbi:unnamed protein product [Urochloa humidicola]
MATTEASMLKPPQSGSGSLGGVSAANRPRRRHLYLIFDDWKWGYSIRKAFLTPDDEDEPGKDNVTIDRTEHPPPRAIFHLGAPRGAPLCFAVGFDTMIMAMHAKSPYDDTPLLVPKHLVPVFDVRSRAIIFGPRPKVDPVHAIYISTGNKIFALSTGSFELLDQSPLPERDGKCRGCSWRKLQNPPFASKHVTSYAVHPDGHIFVSIVKGTTGCTFCFRKVEDMRCGTCTFGWERNGGWILPFFGYGHFDCELNAWVGLARYPNIGHLCACYVESAKAEPNDGECLSRKVSKENVFTAEPDERPVGATLVYMGGGSQYCLVQCIYKKKGGQQPLQCRCLLRVTTFTLKYDRNGDLTTGYSRRVRYYRVPEEATEPILKHPVAFWM